MNGDGGKIANGRGRQARRDLVRPARGQIGEVRIDPPQAREQFGAL